MTARPPVTRLGLQIASYAPPGVPDAGLFDHLRDLAVTAEDNGYDSVWTMDHVHQIPTAGGEDDPILEAYTTIAALAGVTSRVKLGVLVSAGGLRAPALLAKMVTSLDVLSGGRALCGLGAGWHEPEYTAYGVPFAARGERFALLEDTLRICKAMFAEEVSTVAGRRASTRDARNIPVPLTPGGPPILVGGGGSRTLGLVARHADACNLFGGVETVRRKVALLREECEKVGRDPSSVSVTWLGTGVMAEDEASLTAGLAESARLLGVSPAAARGFVLSGTPAEVAEQVEAYREAGVDGFILNFDDGYDLEHVAAIGRVVDGVLGGVVGAAR
jgi:alkanesulfonate monooxygenase SsuD/methylene tetrahydromethanopterin reductase-like flavin-dependent oxidoreductase (luciferase family)